MAPPRKPKTNSATDPSARSAGAKPISPVARKLAAGTVNGGAERAPNPRLYVDWTPALVRSVMRSADTGNLQRAGELCEWLLTSPIVAGALSARIDQVLSLDVTFTAAVSDPQADAVDTTGEEETDIVAALRVDFPQAFAEETAVEVLQWLLLLGVVVARRSLVVTSDGRFITVPEVWHPSSLTYYPRTATWTARDIDGTEHTVSVDGVVDPAWWFASLGGARPWTLGLWRSIAQPTLALQYAQQDWARTSEKAALWVAKVQVDKDGNPFPGTSDAQRRQIVETLDGRGSDAAIALPAGFDLTLEQQADIYQVYAQQMAVLGDAIALRIRGGNLSSNTSGGSLAAAQAQTQTGDAPKRRSDAKLLTRITRDLFSLWAEYNFGNATLVPTVTWAEAADTQLANVGTLATALKTFDDMGFTFDLDKVKASGAAFITGRDEAKAQANREAAMQKQQSSFGGGFQANASTHACGPECGQPHGRIRNVAPAVSGVTEGQKMVDSFVDQSIAAASEHDTTDEILAIIKASANATELKMALLKHYAHLDLSGLAGVVEKASILANLTGRAQVNAEL